MGRVRSQQYRLTWPPTPAQWENIDEMLGTLFKATRQTADDANDPDLSNLNASNLTSGTVPAARMPALTGDVTTAAGSVATTIAAGAVSYAKLQDVSAASKLLGRGAGGGSGDPEEITLGTNLSMSGTTLNASGGSGSGGLVLLESHTASASASLDFTTRNASGQSGATFQSDYDEYLIELVTLIPATDNVGIGLRVTTDGGSTYISTGSYAWTHWVYGPSGTGQTANTAQTEMRTVGFINVSNTNTFGLRGSIRCFDPLSTTVHKVFGGQVHFWDTGPSLVVDIFSAAYSATTAINGFQVLATSGNLASGAVYVYGIAKT